MSTITTYAEKLDDHHWVGAWRLDDGRWYTLCRTPGYGEGTTGPEAIADASRHGGVPRFHIRRTRREALADAERFRQEEQTMRGTCIRASQK